MRSLPAPIERILLSPEEYYAEPEDVLRDDGLSDEEKLSVLRAWADEIMQLEIATAENMDGPDSAYLTRINICLEILIKNLH